MRQSHTTLRIDTPGRGLVDITAAVSRWVAGTGLQTGLLTVFIRHTSASLLIQENADPDVQADLERFLTRLVPMAIRCSSTSARDPTTCRRTCAAR